MKQYKAFLFISIMALATQINAFSGVEKYTHVFINVIHMLHNAAGSGDNNVQLNRMEIRIGDKVLTATLADNSSVEALIKALKEGPITVQMRDYGNMEKVGSLGREFPRNDESITAEAGDIILFQGRALVIYYDSNSWTFTRLGKIDHVTQAELKEILGDGNVTVTLSLPQE